MSELKDKIVIETSGIRKQVISNHLSKYGSNPTEWFNAKSETVIRHYVSELQNLKLASPASLQDISDKTRVFGLLEKVDWNFSDNETTYLTHDIHPYPAKFIPQIPSNIISALSMPGEIVWDPFGGSGTTALEALLLNRRCFSSDANPLANIIGQSKTITLNDEEQKELSLFRYWLNDIIDSKIQFEGFYNVPQIPNIQKWFHPNAVAELNYLKNLVENLSPNSKIVALVALSRTVSKVSNQESETRYASKPREIARWETIRCFVGDLDIVLSKSFASSTLLQGRTANFFTFDLRNQLNPACPITENSVDLIVTSPPYANATDYHLYHRFRMFWLGFNPIDFGKIEIGSHLRHQKEKTGFSHYMAEMVACLNNCFRALKPGRYAVFVLGDAVFENVVYSTAEAYQKEAENIGFEYVGTLKRSLPKNKRSFESPARRAMEESILVLRKPPKISTVTLQEAPYKLWDFEKVLLERELCKASKSLPKKTTKKEWEAEIDCYDIDKLHQLTFIHRIKSLDFGEETTWQCLVENGDVIENISQRKESKYVTHGVHEYKGKFYPQLCKSLLNLANISPGGTVLDLFMGSGTTILESCLNGYRAFGCDVNPLAVKIAKAKTEVLFMNPSIVSQSIKTLTLAINSDNGHQSNYLLQRLPQEAHNELFNWFPEPVIQKLSFLLEQINKIPDNRLINYLEVNVSNIIRDVSQQDPEDLRIRRRKSPLSDAPVYEMFIEHLEKQLSKLESFYRYRHCSPNVLHKPTIWEGDSRLLGSFHTNGLSDDSVDVVVTSPPYATALPYIDTNRLSLLVLLGLNSKLRNPIESNLIGSREIRNNIKNEIENQITENYYNSIVSPYAQGLISKIFTLNNKNDVGFRRKNMAALLYNYFSSMTQSMENVYRLLKRSGSFFVVIGNNVTNSGDETIAIETTNMLIETAMNQGFYLQEQIPISVTTENMKHANNFIKQNFILWFKKI